MKKTSELEESMYMFYRKVLDIDPETCIPISGDLGKLEIQLREGMIPLKDFVQKSAKPVSIDHFSTKENADKIVDSMGIINKITKPFYRGFYLELSRFWGVLNHLGKNVGMIDTASVYNGFPNLVDPNDLIADPQKTYEKATENLIFTHPRKIFVPPQKYIRTIVRLKPEFLDENPLKDFAIA